MRLFAAWKLENSCTGVLTQVGVKERKEGIGAGMTTQRTNKRDVKQYEKNNGAKRTERMKEKRQLLEDEQE
jgi:hypothetical protein